jgi:hypothetical protein
MSIENKILQKAAELSAELGTARKGFMKNLITVGTGFLALFIGLKSENIESVNAKYFFFITIILLVIGILFSTISLFQEIYYLRKNEKYLKSKMAQFLDKGTLESTLFNFTKKPIFFKICEFIGFASFILSTLTLIGYIFFLEIYQ